MEILPLTIADWNTDYLRPYQNKLFLSPSAGFLKSQTPSEKNYALLVKHAFSDGTYADSLQEFY